MTFFSYPEMVETAKSSYDTYGAKRITEAIAAWELKSGIKKPRKIRAQENVPRKTKDFVVPLYAAATPAEKKMLDRLISRVYGRKAVKAVAQMEVTKVRGKYKKQHHSQSVAA